MQISCSFCGLKIRVFKVFGVCLFSNLELNTETETDCLSLSPGNKKMLTIIHK